MKITRWVCDKMNAIRENKKEKKIPYFAKSLIRFNRSVSLQKTSILARKDFTRTVKPKDEKERKK